MNSIWPATDPLITTISTFLCCAPFGVTDSDSATSVPSFSAHAFQNARCRPNDESDANRTRPPFLPPEEDYAPRETTARGLKSAGAGSRSQFRWRVAELLAQAKEDAAIDHVIGTLDELLRIGAITACDQILESSINSIPAFSAGLIASFLGITWKAKDRLPSRAAFFDEAERVAIRKWGAEETHRLLNWFK